MPSNKNAHLRFKIVDLLLSSGGTYSKREILDRMQIELGFPVSQFTFDKDVRWLRNEFKAPIKYDANGGYYYESKNFRLFNQQWAKEEMAALDFAYEALNTLNNIELAEEAQTVLRRLTNGMRQRETKPGKRIIYRPPSPEVKGLEWLPELYEAIDKEIPLTIKYYKLQTDEIKTHTISPYILRQYNDLWYVVAWCATRELTLVFALDRIREALRAHISYYKDPNFNADEYFKYSFGITHSYTSPPEKIQFQIRKEAYYYLQINPLHQSQRVVEQTSKGYVIQIEIIISAELIRALLGFGTQISVRSPTTLRELMQVESRLTFNTANIV